LRIPEFDSDQPGILNSPVVMVREPPRRQCLPKSLPQLHIRHAAAHTRTVSAEPFRPNSRKSWRQFKWILVLTDSAVRVSYAQPRSRSAYVQKAIESIWTDASGDLLATADAPATVTDRIGVRLVAIGTEGLASGRPYLLKLGTATVTARIEPELQVIDLETHRYRASRCRLPLRLRRGAAPPRRAAARPCGPRSGPRLWRGGPRRRTRQ
jgi:hypothetical protein